MSFKCTECELVLIGRKPKECPECGCTRFTKELKLKNSMKTFLGVLIGKTSKS